MSREVSYCTNHGPPYKLHRQDAGSVNSYVISVEIYCAAEDPQSKEYSKLLLARPSSRNATAQIGINKPITDGRAIENNEDNS